MNVPKLMRIDFTLLLEEELNWQLRTEISKETVHMMDAAAVYYNADFGCVLRWLGGKNLKETRMTASALWLRRTSRRRTWSTSGAS